MADSFQLCTLVSVNEEFLVVVDVVVPALKGQVFHFTELRSVNFMREALSCVKPFEMTNLTPLLWRHWRAQF